MAVKLDDLKTMIGLKTDSDDKLLNLIITKTEESLRFKLGLTLKDEIPEEMEYIAFEVCVRRYNRRSNEGMTAYGQEGETISFSASDFNGFEVDIAQWRKDHDKGSTRLGGFMFI